MSVLSDVDIKKEIGENILIYPFFKKNIKGASYNLTASKLAWDLETKETIYDKNNNTINIKVGQTALIETNEAIWVSSKITGSYHSKVKLVSQGLSHIGTTLDPEYLGLSLITVHNYGSEPIDIIPERDTFVTLVFYYVSTESSINPQGNNPPGQQQLLNSFKVEKYEKDWLDENFRTNKEALKSQLEKDSNDFKDILLERERQKTNQRQNRKKIFSYVIFVVWFVFFISLIILQVKKESLESKDWFNWVVNTINATVYLPFGGMCLYLFQKQIDD